MSTIRINTGTVKGCAQSITRELPEWYNRLIACHRDLVDMMDEDWQGETAENLTSDFFSMIFARYIMPNQRTLQGYAKYLTDAAQTHEDTEAANANIARTPTTGP
ncbi:MAG: hypothetical protein FWG40_12675 [Peptococcaceae bacterium]|nr:hypothetical protein [Peptococcaceae bacterium]